MYRELILKKKYEDLIYMFLINLLILQDLLMIREQIQEATKFLHSTEVILFEIFLHVILFCVYIQKSVNTTELWLKYESLTMELAHMLYERIRLTFQPTQASQLK